MRAVRSLQAAAIATVFVACGSSIIGCSGSSPQQIAPALGESSRDISLDPHRKTLRYTIAGSISDNFTTDWNGGVWLISTRSPKSSTLVHIDRKHNVMRYELPIPSSSI